MANGLVYLGLGAALMYLTDPQAGRKRRADLRNQVDATLRKVQHGKDLVVRDASNRAQGLIAETRGALDSRRHNVVAMNGPTLGAIARESIATWNRDNWSPSQRALAGGAGAALLAGGYLRGGLRGFAMCVLGGGLMARATANESFAALVKGHGIRVEKTVRVDCTVGEVFAYWRNLENFPQWMSHVREVRHIGGNRHHWVVDGPAGVPVEWDSELLNVSENREMTWRSLPGSQVDNTGRVRFEEDGTGTRIHVQMHYSPPGGILGHAVAKAFGVDPKSEMDEDLERMKIAIETGRAPRDSAAQRRVSEGLDAPPGLRH